ncbi:NAD(P)-dependent oxidoreductase [Streptomyces ferrugineus]|uniref:NAD(P)-dependent oxidoreductase n=1 Tax=Streptomyces ferrugineus TaxID=1413221 RepID=A0A7M2SI63_9ACTN|nr:NAD(P)-dependent oxidoreductase [Streptomyces ferrugineus]QOV35719.1 NAD(P)-dependent oxidoreductase [Streptomyces ferrugineus]
MSGPATGGVLVLGGSGFVGREVCAALTARGQRALSAARGPQDGAAPGVRAIRLDLGSDDAGQALAHLLDSERPHTVVNCVGSIWGRTDAEMAPAIVAPTLRLLAALGRAAVRPRLVHLGSVLEYGPVPAGTTARGPARPDTEYGRAKLAATEAVLAAHRAGDVDALVLRVANVAGPGTPAVSLLGRVAARLAAAAPGTGPVSVELSPLRAHRDYVDVRDVADAVVRATDRHVPAAGAVVDIGRGEAVPVRELVDLLIAVSGVRARVTERGAPGAADWMRVDPGPALDLLGWRPRHSLTDAVRAYWEAHRKQTGDSAVAA